MIRCLVSLSIITILIDLLVKLSGAYGQLGHGNVMSSDEPRRLEFFKDQGLNVVEVVCGPWNTFVGVINEESDPP